jgi:hypothetical protein
MLSEHSRAEVCQRRKKGFCGVQNDTVLVGLARPTFGRHELRKRLRVQLVQGVGTMRNLSIN